MESNKATYETGATSHTVNDLILFTDNTKELVNLRDNIYETMQWLESLGAGGNWENERFRKLLNKARATYCNELGGDNSLHIINMPDTEKIEFMQLYINNFDNWKSGHH